MRWSLAKDHIELDHLFDVWQTDLILIKRSDTYGGTSVTLFTRDRAKEIQWDPSRDLFCPEVNPDDGDYQVKVLKDGWAVVTADGSLSAQWEHTVRVTEDGVDVLTA